MGFDQSALDEIENQTITPESVDTERLHITRNSPIVRGSVGWRSDFDGSDEDTRLDNALSAAEPGDVILLEKTEYTTDRTIATAVQIVGTQGISKFQDTRISANWTFNERIHLNTIHLDTSGSITINTNDSAIEQSRVEGSVTVAADFGRYTSITGGGSITLQSGTGGCIVDSVSFVSVTDNGSNTVGDTA